MSTPEQPFAISENFPVRVCQWSDVINAQATDRGWWQEGKDRNPGRIILLMISELCESFEEFRKPDIEFDTIYYGPSADPENHPDIRKPEGIPIEVADAVIRILDFMAVLAPDAGGEAALTITALDALVDYGDLPKEQKKVRGDVPADFGDAVINAIPHLMNAYSFLSQPNEPKPRRFRRALRALCGCIVYLFKVSERFEFDLSEAITMKFEYNATRPYRHGGKRA